MTQPHLSRDPLAGLFARGTAKPGTDLQFRTGLITTWFTDSGNNLVVIDGVELRNVPILYGSVDITLFARGDEALMLVTRDARGVATYLIIGRARTPDGSEW